MREHLGGLRILLGMGLRSRFRLGGAYWRWRLETAMGSNPAGRLGLREQIQAILEYGRWAWCMRRLGRGDG